MRAQLFNVHWHVPGKYGLRGQVPAFDAHHDEVARFSPWPPFSQSGVVPPQFMRSMNTFTLVVKLQHQPVRYVCLGIGIGSPSTMIADAFYTSSFVQAAFFFEDFTTASMKAMPRTPSSIFG